MSWIFPAIAGCIMGVFITLLIVYLQQKKHNKKLKNIHDSAISNRQQLQDKVRKVQVLIALAENKVAIQEGLKQLENTLFYATPSANSAVTQIDAKIDNLLDDIKIDLHKYSTMPQKTGKVLEYLKEIDLLLIERNAYTER